MLTFNSLYKLFIVDEHVPLLASMGISIVLSSVNWFYVWLGIEIAMISFLGLLSTKGELYQKLVTYFIAQVFGRFVLLLGANTTLSGSIRLVLIGVTFKLGFVGGHIWASGFVIGLSRMSILWFLVVLKVSPLAIFMGSLPLVLTAMLTTMVGLRYLGISSRVQEFIYWTGLTGRS